MVTREAVLAWQPHALESASDAIARGRSAMVGLEDELSGHRRGSHWWGDARAAADLRVERLRCRLADLVAEMSVVVSAIDAEVAELRAIRDDLVDLLARNLPFPVDAIAGVPGRTRALVARAGACDDRIAAALQRARSGLVDAGSLSLRAAALPSHLRDMTTTELVDWSLAHPADAPPYLSAMPESVRRRLGEELAARLSDGPPTDDLALVEGLGEDEVVATSALRSLGPESFTALAASLPATAAVLRLPGQPGNLPARLRTALGRMLGAATADDEPAGRRRVPPSFDRALARQVEPFGFRGHGARTVALSRLLPHAASSRALLTTVGSAILEAEVEGVRERPEEALGQVLREKFGPFGIDGHVEGDPLPDLMQALAANPDAARDLLSHDVVDYMLGQSFFDGDAPRSAAFGDALVAATTVDPDARSVKVAEATLASLQDRWERLSAKPDITEAHYVPPELRGHVGTIVGHYLPSVHEALGGLEAATLVDAGIRADLEPPVGDVGLVYDGERAAVELGAKRRNVGLLIADIGKDADAGRALVAQSNAYTGELLMRRLSGIADFSTFEEESRRAMSTVVAPNQALVSAVNHGLASVIHAEQVERDGVYNTVQSLKVSAGTTGMRSLVSLFAPVLPGPAETVIGGGINATGDLVKQEFMADSTGSTNREVGLLTAASEAEQEALVVELVEKLMPAAHEQDAEALVVELRATVRRDHTIAAQQTEELLSAYE